MENLLLSLDEQKVVWKSKNILENKFNVNILLPDYDPSCERDVAVVTIHGENINRVKNFIQRKINMMKWKQERRITVQNDVTTITISDSDDDSSFPVLMETQQQPNKRRNNVWRKRKRATNVKVDLSSTVLIEDSEESANEDSVQKRPKDESVPPVDFIPINTKRENSVALGKDIETKEQVQLLVPGANLFLPDNAQVNGNTSKRNEVDNTIILSDSSPDFISLRSGKEKENIPDRTDDSIIIIEDEIPQPIKPKCLRPVVIDGSNVAREHGKVSKTFSCKGIKIAVDYFLQRGHTVVTAFVPLYRRHCKFGPILTTDQPLLEELSNQQHVVFTPSRRIDNKRVTCYDDRFIVDLATKNGGVILSNDNYRDIASESDEFKKTVNERLLMFCFVGDIIMIPQDPLGRNGPSLDNFLSFPN